ncbi:NADPH-dependent FMN reductase [Psychromonas sp. PT13]|uniref:NADPH-dependent FMN reductase n=1 Tax=Psychromonas sp. PT13 TaxID=3439547 RepID=UPI003EBEED34
MKVLAFAASSSRNSINKQLANFTASQIPEAQVELLDINDYEMPLFSEDREKELGHPTLAKAFYQKLGEADIIVIAFAEHNGSYTAAYKNLFDWTSRIDMKVFQNKPVIMLAASPGPGGATSVLASAQGSAPFFAADLKGAISVPNFYDNFDLENGQVTNKTLLEELQKVIAKL